MSTIVLGGARPCSVLFINQQQGKTPSQLFNDFERRVCFRRPTEIGAGRRQRPAKPN